MTKRDKMKINIVAKDDKNSDLQFWMNKTPKERIGAVEFLKLILCVFLVTIAFD